MSDDITQTNGSTNPFDFSSFPPNTLFHERRDGRDRRNKGAAAAVETTAVPAIEVSPPAAPERRAKKERRKRIDPTTFEKQYTDDELEFMNAMQRFKEQSGKAFPTHGEVLMVASSLGYRRVIIDPILDLASPEDLRLEIN